MRSSYRLAVALKSVVLSVLLCLSLLSTAGSEDQASLRPNQVAQRADDLVARLTPEEKISLLQTDSPAITRLGIPAYSWLNEALHGVARAGTATVFPQAIGMAATFDNDLIAQIGHAIAEEGRAKFESAPAGTRFYGLTYFTPVVNIARDPRWGRTQETYGEDPLLTSALARSFVQGLEGPDPDHPEALATLKHFAAYSGPEQGRAMFDARVSTFDLADTYLSQFERVVRTTPVASIMTSYNEINGVPASLDEPLIEGWLRRTWAFQGYVVTDCDAIGTAVNQLAETMPAPQVAAEALRAGVDLDCGTEYHFLLEALKTHLISLSDIDRALRRLLLARLRLGTIGSDVGPYASVSASVIGSSEHRALARRAALESIVLLKNDAGILPLDTRRMRRIAVVGALAGDRNALIGDYAGEPSSLVTLEQALASRADRSGAKVTYYLPDGSNGSYRGAALDLIAKVSDVVIAVFGVSSTQEGEDGAGGDRVGIELPASQSAALKAMSALHIPVILVLTGGSAFALEGDVDTVAGILDTWYSGEEGGAAFAAVLFGDANPSGRLPLTFYARTSDLPAFDDYSMAGRTYRYFRGQPVFRFGDGLSFTRFRYRDPLISVDEDRGPVASVTVDNLGGRDGDEVVQAYILPPVRLGVRAENRHLAGFARVTVPQGKSRRVSIPLGWWAFSSVDATGARAVRSGHFGIFIGGGQPGLSSAGVQAYLDLSAVSDGRRLRASDYALGTPAVEPAVAP